MVDDLDDEEFWLPSQFMKEEDIITDFGASAPTTISTAGFYSELGSPAKPVMKTESDVDKFFTKLTRLSYKLDFGFANPKD